MKYGCILINKGSLNTNVERVINIGDDMQILGVLNLYKNMGVKKEDIIRIEYYDLFTYSGEDLILPINFIWFNPFWGETELILSEKIYPVFLGIHSIGNDYKNSEIEYLRKFEPIGCRDAYTYKTLSARGIKCYLHGCITATFPRRKPLQRNGNIYMVDVQDELLEFIPEEIRSNAKALSHQFYGNLGANFDWENETRKRLELYRDDAELVITSRLHCASPCVALGIPTIFAPKRKASTYSWINQILPIYDQSEWKNIEWNPAPVDFELLKKKIIESDIRRIRSISERGGDNDTEIEDLFEITGSGGEEFENLELMRIKQFAASNWGNNMKVKYAMYGITQVAESAYKYLKENYPNVELVDIYDNNRKINFLNCDSRPISDYDISTGVYLVATGNSTSIAAKKMFVEKKWDDKYLCTCFEGLHDKM